MSLSAAEGPPSGKRLSRRGLLVAGAGGAAAAAGFTAGTADAAGATYPRLRIVELAKLQKNHGFQFAYPLEAQPNVLIDFDHPVPDGVGPDRSIVAYSILCQHMGCPVEYHRDQRIFSCPCHQTRYDPERLGSIIQGIALLPLPRIRLKVQGGAVWATGVDGLIFGYRSNLTPGKRVGGVK
jgi:arsenite oxidase small subunit